MICDGRITEGVHIVHDAVALPSPGMLTDGVQLAKTKKITCKAKGITL